MPQNALRQQFVAARTPAAKTAGRHPSAIFTLS